MDIVLTLHSLTRWLIVIVAAIVIVKFALGWLQKQDFTSTDRGLASAFAGLMDLQMLLGLALLFLFTGANRFAMEHAFTMVLAIVCAHLPAMWRRAPDTLRFRNSLFAVLASLVLIVLGVARVGGWS